MSGVHAAGLSLGQWADIATLVTAVFSALVLGGLLLAGREYRRQVEENRVAVLTGMTQYLNEVAKVFVEYPKMKKYFHEGRRPGWRDRARAEAIAVTLANAMDHVISHLDLAEEGERSAWESYFAYVYAKSPTLQDYLAQNSAWYGPKLREQFRLK